MYIISGVHNLKKNLKGRSVNRPRCNEILYQRCLASGYTIFRKMIGHVGQK